MGCCSSSSSSSCPRASTAASMTCCAGRARRPRRRRIGAMADFTVYPDAEPSKTARALAEQIGGDGGHVLAVYQEPVGEHWQIFCLLPRTKVEASPYQRDLSPTHVKRLTETIKRLDRFVDPSVVISPKPGVYWTPNGN